METASPSFEKTRVALISLIAAALLALLKLVVGLLTHSLGLLSEALHSSLDWVATGVTLVAVRYADRPADETHPYGHGKAENLAAFVETFLLLLTCLWIVKEALERLFFKVVRVEATWPAFTVVLLSIGVDAVRSRALLRAARLYRSQALEADAYNFRTDMWASLAVLLGLLGVWLGERWGGAEVWHKADALAALVVAGFVFRVGYRLGRRAVDVLLDRAPVAYVEQIRRAAQGVSGVQEVGRVRVREAGSQTFVDLVVRMAGQLPLEHAHEIAQTVEEAVMGILPEADVMVHVEPQPTEEKELVEQVRAIAARQGHLVHHVGVQRIGQQYYIDLDVEFEEDITLEEAHRRVSSLEQALRIALPSLAAINTRLEAREARVTPVRDVTQRRQEILQRVRERAQSLPAVLNVHNIQIREAGDRLYLNLHCVLDGRLSLRQAHELATCLEQQLSQEIPELGRVTVHTEPPSRPRRSRAKGWKRV